MMQLTRGKKGKKKKKIHVGYQSVLRRVSPGVIHICRALSEVRDAHGAAG